MAIILSDKLKSKLNNTPDDRVIVLDIVNVDSCCSAILDINPYWAKKSVIEANAKMLKNNIENKEFYYHRSLVNYINEHDFILDIGLMGSLKIIDNGKKLMKSLY